MIKKLIEEQKDDNQAHFINDIILSTKLRLDKDYIRLMGDKAKKLNLHKIAQMLIH